MNLHVSRQAIYLMAIALLLLIVVFAFSLFALIPTGKEYRIDRLEKKKHEMILRQHQSWHQETFERLKNLQSDHKRVIMGFDNSFDAERFVTLNQQYFEKLTLTKSERQPDDNAFSIYEVNASTKIDSPMSFYHFLDAINKSEWIIAVNFPIHFEREHDLINSSFTMKVYGVSENYNASSDANSSDSFEKAIAEEER